MAEPTQRVGLLAPASAPRLSVTPHPVKAPNVELQPGAAKELKNGHAEKLWLRKYAKFAARNAARYNAVAVTPLCATYDIVRAKE